MGLDKLRRPFISPHSANVDMRLTAGAALPAFKTVRMSALNTVVQTTGSSGVRIFGVTQTTAASAATVPVRVWGVTNVLCSSNAIAAGAWLRATSGAATTKAGGTVRASTTAAQNVIGIALTSAAAGTAARTISMLITQSGLSRIV